MALPFARSERSLQKDDYRTALIVGVLALPLFIGWLGWFFAGSLPLYESSQQLTVGEKGTIVATFDSADVANVQQGEQIRLKLEIDGESTSVPAIVAGIDQAEDGAYEVSVYPDPNVIDVESLSEVTGEVEIERGNYSPFSYLIQLGEQ